WALLPAAHGLASSNGASCPRASDAATARVGSVMHEALIIEDEPNERLGLSALLDAEGFRTRTADSIAAARRRLTASVPELVILDLSLPDGSGLELMEDLGGSSRPEIIVLTGHATVESAIQAIRGGARDYLVKPIEPARLRELVAGIAKSI